MTFWPWQPTQVVEVERRAVDDAGDPVTDSHGNVLEEYGEAERLDDAVFAPAMPSAGQEPFRPGRPSLLVDTPAVYLKPGQMIDALDRVLVDGKPYQVAGEPGDWRDPFDGEPYGVAVALRNVEG